MDTLRPDPKALQAAAQKNESKQPPQQVESPAPAQPKNEAKPQEKPKPVEPKPPAERPGETLLARATPRPETMQPSNPSQPQPQQRRPRTLAEAKANKGIIEAPKMKQEGGVRRAALDPGFNVKETPFGTYDAKFIQAVQARWFSLLDQRDYVGAESGRVVVEFRLKQDGRITNMRVVDSNVSEVLSWFCQRAILDPAPYEPFPSDLRRMMDTDYREIRFTFYYNQ
jgi:outer membrane biosynthesis protein TonB